MKNDHATKADLNELKDELKNDTNELRNVLKNDMNELRNELKNDMNELKDELKNDMNALKDEFKNDMKDMREDIGVQLINLNSKVEQNSLELKIEMNEKFDTVITALDGIAGLISDNRVEKAAAESTFRRHEAKLDEHENRIGNLEKRAV
jgi:DNA anti-recombination protein RmuC